MQKSKDFVWPKDYRDADSAADAKVSEEEVAAASNDDSVGDGWQQYRRWISKAPITRTRRSSIDPALYSWKGYRNWSEEVKRNWKDKPDE
ncbi:MAG: hypothetical protein WBN23_13825 [Woeseia sp.]|jgi:hypothetical protein